MLQIFLFLQISDWPVSPCVCLVCIWGNTLHWNNWNSPEREICNHFKYGMPRSMCGTHQYKIIWWRIFESWFLGMTNNFDTIRTFRIWVYYRTFKMKDTHFKIWCCRFHKHPIFKWVAVTGIKWWSNKQSAVNVVQVTCALFEDYGSNIEATGAHYIETKPITNLVVSHLKPDVCTRQEPLLIIWCKWYVREWILP